jgi:hypothetical protein
MANKDARKDEVQQPTATEEETTVTTDAPPGPISSRAKAKETTDTSRTDANETTVVDVAAIVTDDTSVPTVPQADAAAVAAGLPFRTDPTKVLEHDPVSPDDPQPVVLDAADQAQRNAEIARLEVVASGTGDAAEAAKASLRSLRHNGIRTDAQAIAIEHGE